MVTRKNLLALAVSTSLAATMVACSGTGDVAKDDTSAKTATMTDVKAKEGKCGEGKCGGDKANKEGKCGEGKCGSH